MLNMTPAQIQELAQFAFLADKEARSDLIYGYIATENDYTSNFTGALRRIVNANSTTGLKASSYVLPPPDERLSGCDAAIVITSNGFVKIITFEAKYPRLKQPYFSWDYAQTSSGISHFSDQLERQKNFAGTHAIFEMFYCEMDFGAQPDFMQRDVSSCIWHREAVAFDEGRLKPGSVWSGQDLANMLKKGNYPISTIIEKVCECEEGEAFKAFGTVLNIAREFSLFGNVLHVAVGDNPLAEGECNLAEENKKVESPRWDN